ncbi:MAG: bifunctional phosphopantothenoylcysteine decarboxylase/phosphopantothenate--cysteine ligase CoaBC [Acidobacteriota bacterium]
MKIALGVTGCIGAYKAALILRALQEKGAQVQVVMTHHACQFVQPLTFQALSGEPVITDMFAATERSDILHISLAQEISLLLVAPATANIIAKFAHGIADDFLSTLYLSTPAKVLIAPAMNVEMWRHPVTQQNVATLQERGVAIINPEAGYLACRMEGEGRLADPQLIAARAYQLASLAESVPVANTIADLAGEHVLVTAGPTREYLDPIRFITNHSSGKMGYALAAAAHQRGAEVTLISGPVQLEPPQGVKVVKVTTTHQMYEAVQAHYQNATIIIKAAAVCDYRPRQTAAQKIKKQAAELSLALERTEDILTTLGTMKGNRLLVGFAAETESLIEHAEKKLIAKNLDLIVANDVTASDAGFDADTNRVILIRRDGQHISLPLLSKRVVADRILDQIVVLKTNTPTSN